VRQRRALSLSATQVDRRIMAVVPVDMYDHNGSARASGTRLTEEDRNNLVDSLAEQRYAGLGAMASVPTQPGAPSGFAPPNTR
jgi:hypothetical protein